MAQAILSKSKQYHATGVTHSNQLENASLRALDPFEEDIQFILEVKKYPTLFTVAGKQARYKNVKEQMWKSIGKKMNTSIVECKKRWKCLRDRYAREKRIKLNSEVVTPDYNDPSGWPLLSHLNFLSDHIKHRNLSLQQNTPETSNLETEDFTLAELNSNCSEDRSNGDIEPRINPAEFQDTLSSILKMETPDSDPEKDLSDAEMAEPMSKKPVTEKLRKRKYKSIKEPDDVEDSILKTLTDLRNENRIYVTAPPSKMPSASASSATTATTSRNAVEFMDEDEMFCMSIAAEMRRMTEKQKSYTKMMIQKTMFDVKFGNIKELSEDTPRQRTSK